MRILFVHQNFPAQFRYIALALKHAGHAVQAVTSGENKQHDVVPTLRYPFEAVHPSKQPPLVGGFLQAIRQGRAAGQALRSLRDQGFVPDIVVGHIGWGESILVKDIWPRTRLIMHAEFYYASDGANINFDPEFGRDTFDRRLGVRVNNAPILLAMIEADQAVAPTNWQRSRFPAPLRERIEVIHEGIDTGLFLAKPDASFTLPNGMVLRAGDEVVTFVNRNLEPYRGYHIFMRALPKILAARPKAHAVIVGGDGVSYGAAAPEGTTWKATFLAEVQDRLPLDRVHLVGKIPYFNFRDLMQVSMAHVYLTYPFVLSWSMLEAMSAECLVIASRTPPVEEILTHEENGLLFEFFDTARLTETVAEALEHPARYAEIRRRARQTIVDRFDRDRVCLPAWLALIDRA